MIAELLTTACLMLGVAKCPRAPSVQYSDAMLAGIEAHVTCKSGGLFGCQRPPVGAYQSSGIITLRGGNLLESCHERAVLVHELVHHIQAKHRWARDEKQAYAVQYEFYSRCLHEQELGQPMVVLLARPKRP